MERVNTILKGIALATVPVVGVCLCLLLLQLSEAVNRQSTSVTSLLGQANTALSTINRSCGSGHPCGTLAEIDKLSTHTSDLIVESQLAIHHADQVSMMESAMLPEWNRQFTTALGNVNQAALTTSTSVAQLRQHATTVLDTTNTTIAGVQPLLGRSTLFVGDADTFVKTLPPLSARAQTILDNGDTLSHDAIVEEQKYVYPKKVPWYKNILPIVLKSGELAYDFIR